MPIWVRAKHIDLREEMGHWEADLIIGRGTSGFANLVTLTERVSRITYIKKLKVNIQWK